MTAGMGYRIAERDRRDGIIEEIKRERQSQDMKWGEQNHHPFKYLAILGEEVGEANKAACEAHDWGSTDENVRIAFTAEGLARYREEMIQVAAVALAMVECLDRGKWNTQKEK